MGPGGGASATIVERTNFVIPAGSTDPIILGTIPATIDQMARFFMFLEVGETHPDIGALGIEIFTDPDFTLDILSDGLGAAELWTTYPTAGVQATYNSLREGGNYPVTAPPPDFTELTVQIVNYSAAADDINVVKAKVVAELLG